MNSNLSAEGTIIAARGRTVGRSVATIGPILAFQAKLRSGLNLPGPKWACMVSTCLTVAPLPRFPSDGWTASP